MTDILFWFKATRTLVIWDKKYIINLRVAARTPDGLCHRVIHEPMRKLYVNKILLIKKRSDAGVRLCFTLIQSTMSSEVLEKLFHSKAEVKLLRLFFNNPQGFFLSTEAAEKSKTDPGICKKEIANLLEIRFLLAKKKSGKVYYGINPTFTLLAELKKLIFKANPTSSDKITAQVERLGQIRLLVLAGALINAEKGRVDILIVGEHISKSKLTSFLENTEAEIGRSINYVSMSTDEFRYRKSMFDKFIIDILEGPHKILIDKLKMELS